MYLLSIFFSIIFKKNKKKQEKIIKNKKKQRKTKKNKETKKK